MVNVEATLKIAKVMVNAWADDIDDEDIVLFCNAVEKEIKGKILSLDSIIKIIDSIVVDAKVKSFDFHFDDEPRVRFESDGETFAITFDCYFSACFFDNIKVIEDNI